MPKVETQPKQIFKVVVEMFSEKPISIDELERYLYSMGFTGVGIAKQSLVIQ